MKKATTTNEVKKTCQVCGRAIKAGKGTIAHHGFKRPSGWGMQTASCEGAQYLPFEESCERLKEVIKEMTAYLASQEQEQAKFLTNPPATLISYEKNPRTWENEKKEYTKPDGFNPNGYLSSRMYTYDGAYIERKSKYVMTIRAVKAELETMRKRLAAWKPASI